MAQFGFGRNLWRESGLSLLRPIWYLSEIILHDGISRKSLGLSDNNDTLAFPF